MYSHGAGFIECCACSLAPTEPANMGDLAAALGVDAAESPELFEDFEMNGSLQFNTRSEALEHLQAHRDAGHKVPEYAFERLRKELEEEGETIPVMPDIELTNEE
jgi:hypothetical protein